MPKVPTYPNWAEQKVNPKPHPKLGVTKRMVRARLVREAVLELALLGWSNHDIAPLTPFSPHEVGTILAAYRTLGIAIPTEAERRQRYYGR